MDTDLLLTWLSETGSGDVRSLRDRLAWYMRVREFPPDRRATGLWLRDLSALGHAEIDWRDDKWAIAPAAAALLPACGGTAVLTGSRRIGLREAIQKAEDLAFFERPHATDDTPLAAPTSLFVQSDSLEQLRSALAELGICLAGEASSAIAKGLPKITLGAPAAPPQRGLEVEHLSVRATNVCFVPGLPTRNGLCRFKDLGQHRFVYRHDGDWYHTDYAKGVLLELAARGAGVIRWQRDRIADGRAIGRLFVDQGSPLPPLQTRALVLCSGLPVRFSKIANTAIYRNVPKDIADKVAGSVHQVVEVDH